MSRKSCISYKRLLLPSPMHASPFLTLSFHQSSHPATPTRILPLRLRTPSLRLETTPLGIA
ncbi:hypothetical protein OIDMADRAFT_18921 [Oidiodendron maius Zn]|uniref:Uncharacterized protein n=1 Tax=Oidiodendron maius (strain Zn) TaxID=913774 RepID=A0A0C3HGS5_OIDMZ|nr:hypothetical protein OIDMADRAFT_18921 [Oidiodendron maius Zn]